MEAKVPNCPGADLSGRPTDGDAHPGAPGPESPFKVAPVVSESRDSPLLPFAGTP